MTTGDCEAAVDKVVCGANERGGVISDERGLLQSRIPPPPLINVSFSALLSRSCRQRSRGRARPLAEHCAFPTLPVRPPAFHCSVPSASWLTSQKATEYIYESAPEDSPMGCRLTSRKSPTAIMWPIGHKARFQSLARESADGDSSPHPVTYLSRTMTNHRILHKHRKQGGDYIASYQATGCLRTQRWNVLLVNSSRSARQHNVGTAFAIRRLGNKSPAGSRAIRQPSAAACKAPPQSLANWRSQQEPERRRDKLKYCGHSRESGEAPITRVLRRQMRYCVNSRYGNNIKATACIDPPNGLQSSSYRELRPYTPAKWRHTGHQHGATPVEACLVAAQPLGDPQQRAAASCLIPLPHVANKRMDTPTTKEQSLLETARIREFNDLQRPDGIPVCSALEDGSCYYWLNQTAAESRSSRACSAYTKRSPRKPADQRRSSARLPRAKIRGATPPGIELGSPMWEASSLTTDYGDGRQVFSGICRFFRLGISALLPTHLASTSSVLKTSMSTLQGPPLQCILFQEFPCSSSWLPYGSKSVNPSTYLKADIYRKTQHVSDNQYRLVFRIS
ncbi:hypothetical protein PR048_006280 [Dryococelus australis]|uniref:Uncharacterized protein n=1 Tax=Dryococelus australis TaxID=614101 RepID=A0ABQ9IBT1_9NEOP|nr:hypothetical protein PR048_006280 [Dryococelus australis]